MKNNDSAGKNTAIAAAVAAAVAIIGMAAAYVAVKLKADAWAEISG